MGSFYANVTLLGTTLDAALAAVGGPALGYADGDAVVLFAAEDDEGELQTGARLSGALGCTAFGAGVHDDDILFFEVHRDGTQVLEGAVPDPAEVFGEGEPGDPPDPAALVAALGQGDVARVTAALAGDVVFASDRHQALCEALGLPTGAVGWGHRYLEEDPEAYDGPPLTSAAG